MASWEDIDDSPEDVPVTTPISSSTTGDLKGGDQTTPSSTYRALATKDAPPLPMCRPGTSESTGIPQAYLASQPKMRILQRQSPATAKKAANASDSTIPAADESAARLHANFEQKQREYEAARKKLFDESHSDETAD